MVSIVHLSDAFVVVNKPAGCDFHDDQGTPGLFTQVRQHLREEELYPVHRLDKVTSGLVVMARTADANRELCEQFRQAQVQKYYLAISAKKPVKKQGAIAGDMQPARRGAWRLARSMDNPARTVFVSSSLAPGLRLFLLKPFTGKTHQLRVALKSIGAPILGDTLYAGEPADRVYLHAWRLGFQLAGQGYVFTQTPDFGEHFMRPELPQALAAWSPPEQLSWPRV
ncbi:TIGR01621 family pseudouridine synthase [Gilvimarinus sp. DA14]|uniref:TIGR01621 family pseudouridine synthase n=1 Tax=Gilvimarinus sp. DA14 TaxID=2956798 RepID=UPI0020B88195|nr:TIGR01621 family pseudouridine synthase [Gilvimarinus sp. DA14]UTF61035.1 TIGR01621 family pseudouridine synthase [Gilvimarinus sp. DA14]